MSLRPSVLRPRTRRSNKPRLLLVEWLELRAVMSAAQMDMPGGPHSDQDAYTGDQELRSMFETNYASTPMSVDYGGGQRTMGPQRDGGAQPGNFQLSGGQSYDFFADRPQVDSHLGGDQRNDFGSRSDFSSRSSDAKDSWNFNSIRDSFTGWHVDEYHEVAGGEIVEYELPTVIVIREVPAISQSSGIKSPPPSQVFDISGDRGSIGGVVRGSVVLDRIEVPKITVVVTTVGAGASAVRETAAARSIETTDLGLSSESIDNSTVDHGTANLTATNQLAVRTTNERLSEDLSSSAEDGTTDDANSLATNPNARRKLDEREGGVCELDDLFVIGSQGDKSRASARSSVLRTASAFSSLKRRTPVDLARDAALESPELSDLWWSDVAVAAPARDSEGGAIELAPQGAAAPATSPAAKAPRVIATHEAVFGKARLETAVSLFQAFELDTPEASTSAGGVDEPAVLLDIPATDVPVGMEAVDQAGGKARDSTLGRAEAGAGNVLPGIVIGAVLSASREAVQEQPQTRRRRRTV